MKTLFLVRHAKSSWKYPELSDFDRPLNGRGKRDAPFMGDVLKEKGILPDLMLSSPAVRALTTARTIAEKLGYPKKKIKTDEAIYHASTGVLLQVIQDVNPKHASLMLFGHNPGFTWLANLLSGYDIDNVPTTGAVGIQFSTDSWASIEPESGTLLFFDFPKKYLT